MIREIVYYGNGGVTVTAKTVRDGDLIEGTEGGDVKDGMMV